MIGTKFEKPLQESKVPVFEDKPMFEQGVDEFGNYSDKVPLIGDDGEQVVEQVFVEYKENEAPNTFAKYAQAVEWCVANNARIEDMGDYYEVVAIPEPTAEELEAQALAKAKYERSEAVESITVEVDGLVFDGDEKSQERMARSIVALSDGETITWVLHDNSIANVTKEQLKMALRLAGQKQTELWTKPYEAS